MIYIVGYISADISGYYEESYIVEYESIDPVEVTEWLREHDVVPFDAPRMVTMFTRSNYIKIETNFSFDYIYIINTKVPKSENSRYDEGMEKSMNSINDHIKSQREEKLEYILTK